MARHFNAAEIAGLDPRLIVMLDDARDMAGLPFTITSGYRSPSANEAAGGVKDSAHESGLAVDLACSDARTCFTMVRALLHAGFVRIGVYNFHVHVDIDLSKPQGVMWTGVSH